MTPKKFLDGAGHTCHAVGLELGEVYYGVCLQQPAGEWEALDGVALREADLTGRVVGVELCAGFLDHAHTRAAVDAADPGGGEGAARAVPTTTCAPRPTSMRQSSVTRTGCVAAAVSGFIRATRFALTAIFIPGDPVQAAPEVRGPPPTRPLRFAAHNPGKRRLRH